MFSIEPPFGGKFENHVGNVDNELPTGVPGKFLQQRSTVIIAAAAKA